MSALNCPSCGAGVSPDGSASYVVCDYCGVSISVAEFFKEGSTNTLQYFADAGLSEEETKAIARLSENAMLFIEASDYRKAKQTFEQILTLAPSHLPSRFNLALCELYSGEGSPLERAKASVNLSKVSAKDHQMIPQIFAQKESIAYNIASIGFKQENVFDAINFFQLSLSLVDRHTERDKLIADFFAGILQKCKKTMDNEFASKGKKYSPNRTFLEILQAGAPYCSDLADLGATLLFYARDFPAAINNKIKECLTTLQQIVLQYCRNELTRIQFGILGGIKMTSANNAELTRLTFP
ncbi:MAG: hypothetical protein LBQ68_10650 [Clostridiales bacterium]|jgi:tetratricopeptide (TPR) repeat protein|nr:hypothetical protein [Clostridiales bacterium]